MKNLILLRHAKSVSMLENLSDFKRTLNEKGRQDVPKIANAFSKLDILPDIILCSTAIRTRETLDIFMDTLKLKTSVVFLEDLYHAGKSEIFKILSKYNQYHNIMLVGHNFGISEMANTLSKSGAKEMNTCGLYILQFKTDIEFNKGEILHYLSPKNI